MCTTTIMVLRDVIYYGSIMIVYDTLLECASPKGTIMIKNCFYTGSGTVHNATS